LTYYAQRGRVKDEAIREWYLKAKNLFTCSCRERRAIAIDETKIKVKQEYYYLWAAIDIDTWEILAVQLTKARSSFDALCFIRKVLKACENKPKVYVDGGPWYRWALNRLGLEWEHRTFGPRSTIEQWFFIFKHRIVGFYKRWPHNASYDTILSWCLSFVALYNLRRCLC
jgi:putative transposase